MSISNVAVSRSGKFVLQRQAALPPDALARLEEDMADLDYWDLLDLRGFRIGTLERG